MTTGLASGPIELHTLTDGGQRPADVARGIAGFLSQARTSLDLALYDVRFETDAGALVLAALLAAVQRGVECACSTTSPTPARSRCRHRRRPHPRRSRRFPSRRAASPGSRTSCTTSSSSATAQPSGRARRTGRTTPGRGRRTSSSRSTRRRSPTRTLAFEQLWEKRDVERTGRRRSAAGGRRGGPCARVVHARCTARRSRIASRSTSARRGPRFGSRPRAHVGPDPRHARRGRERGPLRPRRRRRRHAGRPGLPPVARRTA